MAIRLCMVLAAAVFTASAWAADAGAADERDVPSVEWSVAPVRQPVLTDPLVPSERLRTARIGDIRGGDAFGGRQVFSLDRSAVTLSIRRSPSSPVSMVFEQARFVHDVDDAATPALITTSTRVGFEFRRPSTEARLGFNVFRIHLAGGSTLLLKPRRSGMAVTWRAEF